MRIKGKTQKCAFPCFLHKKYVAISEMTGIIDKNETFSSCERRENVAATIKDISRETGLSLATISKYLNGGNVLPKNREKIDAAVEKLHYQVNEIARGLVTNRTRTIGVIVYNIASTFNGTLVSHIGHQLRRNNYGMLICDSAMDAETEAANIRFLVSKKVDGIIAIPCTTDASPLAPAMEAGIPVVTIDRVVQNSDVDSIVINNREAAGEITERLIREGHRKIGLICSLKEYTGAERAKGFRDALEKAGIPVREDCIMDGYHTVAFGYQSVMKILQMEDRPTAVFATNYDLNLGMVMALNEKDVRCPEEISLVGFDDLLLPHVVSPHLTVMKQPMAELGHTAVNVMMDRLSGRKDSPAEITVLKARLIEGNSDRVIG